MRSAWRQEFTAGRVEIEKERNIGGCSALLDLTH